jgi:hypothetical protein
VQDKELALYRDIYIGRQPKDALECSGRVVKIRPEDNENRFIRTKLLIKLNRPKEARKDLEILKAANCQPAAGLWSEYLSSN